MLPALLPLVLLLQADAPDPLLNWIVGKGEQQLARREAAVSGVLKRGTMKERQKEVRALLDRAIGGVPQISGPLNGKTLGEIDAGGYVIQKVVFESLPHYYVTANLYLPKSPGPHPAVLHPIGHWDQGKPAAQMIDGNLALKGFVVLAYDPMGQGERMQAYDRRMGSSLGGGSVSQHLQAGAQSLLLGESFARYHIHDARRGVDYLVSRPEVDAKRIGVTGCSGGGTITTYIAAMDDRIQAAAPACYTNSWHKLLPGPTGDAEQSLPGFLASGLDMADYPESFAPKPWLMLSTEGDFFTPEGARIVYDETKKWYEAMGAADRVKWVVGPGGHGTPLVDREAIYDWMIRWLNNGKGSSKEEPVLMRPDHEFRVTKSGQVSLEYADSRETWQLIRERYEQLKRPVDPERLRARVKALVRTDDFPLDTKVPAKVEGRHPAAVFVGRSQQMEELAKQASATGEIVMWLNPRGTPSATNRDLVGDWLSNTRAMVIGENLPALRAGDIVRGVAMVAARDDVDASRIRVVANDVAGVWALLAAVADAKIAKVELVRTPVDWRSALEGPLARGLYETVVPGLILDGDIPDLAALAGSGRVTWRDPVDWMRNPVVKPGAIYTTFGH